MRSESLGYVMTGNQIYDIDSTIVENKIDFFDSIDVELEKILHL